MKQFVTSNTGASQTLTPTIDEKVKVYDDYATACSCIACLAEGEIVATKSGNPLDMSAVKEYMADQFKLSDPVDMTSCVVADTSTWEAPYDGELLFRGAGCAQDGYVCIGINGCTVGIEQANTGNIGTWFTTSASVNKGDLINTRKYLASSTCLMARWYCDRDYTCR